MLKEITRHYDETDAEGYNLAPRIGMLDNRIAEHGKHAGYTIVHATDAFSKAVKRANERHTRAIQASPQIDRWDERVAKANEPAPKDDRHRFSMGPMPLQMFGHPFEIQTPPEELSDHLLLMQFGDSCGLPIQFGPSVIVHLWIKPGDLAVGDFSKAYQTLEMD